MVAKPEGVSQIPLLIEIPSDTNLFDWENIVYYEQKNEFHHLVQHRVEPCYGAPLEV